MMNGWANAYPFVWVSVSVVPPAPFRRPSSHLGTVSQMQLLEDALHVELHSVFADHEAVRPTRTHYEGLCGTNIASVSRF